MKLWNEHRHHDSYYVKNWLRHSNSSNQCDCKGIPFAQFMCTRDICQIEPTNCDYCCQICTLLHSFTFCANDFIKFRMKLVHIRIGTINRHIFIYFKATITYFNTLAIQLIFVSLICPTIPVTMLCFNDAKPLFSL